MVQHVRVSRWAAQLDRTAATDLYYLVVVNNQQACEYSYNDHENVPCCMLVHELVRVRAKGGGEWLVARCRAPVRASRRWVHAEG